MYATTTSKYKRGEHAERTDRLKNLCRKIKHKIRCKGRGTGEERRLHDKSRDALNLKDKDDSDASLMRGRIHGSMFHVLTFTFEHTRSKRTEKPRARRNTLDARFYRHCYMRWEGEDGDEGDVDAASTFGMHVVEPSRKAGECAVHLMCM